MNLARAVSILSCVFAPFTALGDGVGRVLLGLELDVDFLLELAPHRKPADVLDDGADLFVL